MKHETEKRARSMVDMLAARVRLTGLELDVARELLAGARTVEIAAALGITTEAAKDALRSIRRKLRSNFEDAES
jgi:DNA-binding CsgD family transcriptional regulator